jgi:CubicO group peptidase (beta-lactamase class C family)
MRHPNFLLLLLVSMAMPCGFYHARGAELDRTDLGAAADYSADRGGYSFLVVQNGHILYESYTHGDAPDRVAQIFSGTKGFWCVAAAAAVEDGILDFDEPVQDTVTEWRSDPEKSQIRVRDLLSFTAGIEPVFALHGRSIGDRNGYSVRQPAVRAPGASFMYGPSQLQIFCELLRRKLAARHLTPEQYLSKRVLRPLGIYGVDFREDRKGNPLLASGFRLSARQWEQLGELILGEGKYRGHQIVRADVLAKCFRGSRANPMFGMGFWLNHVAPDGREVDVEKVLEIPWERQEWRGDCLCRDAPRDMIAAIGSGYQRMFIVPSQKLVIVRQGVDDERFSDARFLRLIFGDDSSKVARKSHQPKLSS